MDQADRVVVTGMGAITPVGHDVPRTWDAVLNDLENVVANDVARVQFPVWVTIYN